ncbi:MAG: HPr family phosphocarrier protein [Rhodospirillaceae bacterium]
MTTEGDSLSRSEDGAAGGEDGSLSRTVRIINERGLHARAAAKFVKMAALYDAAVEVEARGQQVSGASIMGLMMLAAGPGTEILIKSSGAQGQEALDALCGLVEEGFHEI